jgi:Na+/H+ antiporter NhaD/arsenite permease-like protein
MQDIMTSWAGYTSLALFVFAYILVIFEEKLHLRKSKPVILAGTLMWAVVAGYEAMSGGLGHGPELAEHVVGAFEARTGHGLAEEHVKHVIAEIGELFFFVFVAMTYINVMQERQIFDALRAWLIRIKLSYRALFWATGVITFFLSPIADNLTSALLMATVVSAVGGMNRRFIVIAFVNIIIAANAGGAWSPFGDITTLMVWTSGKVYTTEFIYLVLPSIVNWVVPAAILFIFVPKGKPEGTGERVAMKPGARFVIFLGFATIATAVSFHQFLHLPPFLGMMMGLGYLMFTAYFLKRRDRKLVPEEKRFDIFKKIESVEFDTLLFFFGIITAVGALQYVGYLTLLSTSMYGGLGNTNANVVVGVLSAVVDNIPVMYAVLQMNPEMGIDQWLLVTLTAGTGGSLLSVGSAAGVAVMGVRRDMYTFMSHLKWTPIIFIGYIASIGVWWVLVRGLSRVVVPH